MSFIAVNELTIINNLLVFGFEKVFAASIISGTSAKRKSSGADSKAIKNGVVAAERICVAGRDHESIQEVMHRQLRGVGGHTVSITVQYNWNE